ncbi:hypothetical protein ASG40_02820 [Methylobacterium sp. Leaf399]|uniref:hypothetical protein n=1 Tax=Methylobacterium sp. Leaf399 TaxID=1736364 RepID=UPI0006F79C67|nr:hypothetical protein [Methylobacterium sp. Leaf399]KQT19768.1 hypothetical protein ASG40_02820 [Methylobacterium sp. Leaf399]
MKPRTIALAANLLAASLLAASLLAATPALAHEAKGVHGGRVADAGRYHVELVTGEGFVDVYVSDDGARPVPAKGFKATAILVVDGKAARIALEPVAANRLSGSTAVPLSKSPKGAVQLTAPDGSTASGRFD